MVDKRTPLAQCPGCGAHISADMEACKWCGTPLSQPPLRSEGYSGVQGGWSFSLAKGLETLLIVAILGSLIGAVWMMRPEAQSAGLPGPRPTPTPLPTSTATFTRTPAPPPTTTPTATPTPTPSFYVYTVKANDTLIGIALEYGVTLNSILEANGIEEDDFLHLGQELIIPIGDGFDLPTPTATPLPGTEFNVITHTVQTGDTLSDLAMEYDTTVADIVEANDLPGPNALLRINRVLIIPSEAPSPTPRTPTSTPTTTPTETPIPSPTSSEPTATPQFTLPAPVLLGPPDDALLEGEEALLNWVSVGILGDDTWYVVRLRTARPGKPEITHEARVKATSWRVPDDLMPEAGTTQRYRWDVTVVRRIEEEDKALSPRSEIREFQWQMLLPKE